MPISYDTLASEIINGAKITQDQAHRLTAVEQMQDIFSFMSAANRIRHHYKSNVIDLCGVINAKSGKCSENCSFCAQSAYHNTDIQEYSLLSVEEMVNTANMVSTMNAHRVGIVTSGKTVRTKDEIDALCEALRRIKTELSIRRCASLGTLDEDALYKLKEAGLESYHHNLETSESFFPQICTTHSYQSRIDTVRTAKKVGLRVCSGGLFGLGEEWEHRVEMAFTLRDLDVDMVPLNFLHPVKGTRLENAEPLKALEILKLIALYRFILPDKDLRICGGREVNLRGLQPLMFVAGANGTMVGNYLTTAGRDYKQDLQDISDLGLIPRQMEDVLI